MDSLISHWKHWTNTSNWTTLATLVALLVLPAGGFFTARFIDAYRGWLEIGPGGLPYNLKGFIRNLFITARYAKKETKSLGMYDAPATYALGWKESSEDERAKVVKSYRSGQLTQRPGPESKSIYYCIPQRQRNFGEYYDPELKKAYLKAFEQLAEKHADAIEWKTSAMEKRGRAMFLTEAYKIPTPIALCRREVAHIHDSDVSGHVLLSFADAKDVIAKGWGERHRLTGSAAFPLGYTMVYQPRNFEEIDTFISIFESGIEYAKSNGKTA